MRKRCKCFMLLAAMLVTLLFLLVWRCDGPDRAVPLPVPTTPTGPITVPTEPLPTAPSEPDCPTPEPTVRHYTVKPGDTLWGISSSTVAEPYKWRAVWKANKDIIEKPHLIYPGQVLVLP